MMAAAQIAGPLKGGPALVRARDMLARLDRVTGWAVIGAMAVMAGLVVAQVVARYAFASAIDWSEEVARLAFVWAMFLAIPHGVRRGVHVGIDALVVKLPERVQEVLFRASAALAAGLMVVVFAYAWQVAAYTWPEMMPTLPVTAAVYYIAVLLAAVHSVLHLLLLAWGGRNTWPQEAQP